MITGNQKRRDAGTRLRICRLSETDYRVQMKRIVEPYLRKHRRSGYLTGSDGTRIFYSRYLCENARGSIVISHGFSEFTEKYNEMIFYFLQAGYAVFIPEHRGHGRSQRAIRNPQKVYVKSFAQYVRDLHLFVNKIVKPYRNEMLLFAHSMGGAIGALYLETYPDDFQKAVLSSPMIQMKVGRYFYPAAMVIAHLCRLCGFGKAYAAGQHGFCEEPDFEHSCCLSKERFMYAHEKRLKYKSCRTSGASYSWVCAAGKASAYIQESQNINKIKIPVLVFAAGKEHMVDTDEICRFAGKLRYARLVWELEAKHEIFNAGERARLRFYEELFRFLLHGL